MHLKGVMWFNILNYILMVSVYFFSNKRKYLFEYIGLSDFKVLYS